MATRGMDTDTFEKKQDLPQKVCYALSQLTCASDMEECLERMWLEGAVDRTERADLEQSVREVLQHPLVKPHFGKGVEAREVRDIICRKALKIDFALPDRVVVYGKKITLLKFLPNTKNEQKQEKARKDLDKYEHLLRQMGYLQVEKIIVDAGGCSADVVE
jgi:hypothetical protein